jgi:cyclic-di-GMP phosphodiesterase TipF (flagellum assembly factor)
MRGLVYGFIVLVGVSAGVAAHFALTFSPIEAFITAIAVVAISMLALERTLRRRAETRLMAAVAELERLLTASTQAGEALGQRLDTLLAQNAGQRLAAIEADISVLGTVVRQVAEAVAEQETARRRDRQEAPAAPRAATPAAPPPAVPSEPALAAVARGPEPPAAGAQDETAPSGAELAQAIEDGRLVVHLKPIVALPLRRPQAFELVPRLAMPDGGFMALDGLPPAAGVAAVRRRIDAQVFETALGVARRALSRGRSLPLRVPLSRASLAEPAVAERLLTLLEANAVIAGSLHLVLPEPDWSALAAGEKAAAAALVGRGPRLALTGARSLRLDFAALAADRVRSVAVDAGAFIAAPERFTDIHAADIAAYLKRFDIDLVATGIHTEEQVLLVLEDGIGLVEGPHLGGPQPAEAALADPADPARRRAQA